MAFPLYAQSKRLLDGQIEQTVDDKRLLAFDAARAFFSVLSAQAIVAAAEKRLGTAKANLRDSQARVEGKYVGVNDVTRAQIELANSGTELETDKGTLAVARVNLAFTINAEVPATLDVPTALLAAGRAQPPNTDSLVRTAIAHRPDLASKRHLATAAHDFAQEPLYRLFPTVGLAGTFQLSTDNQAVTPGHSFNNNEFLTATLTWPIFDGGVRYADRRSRVASASIADLTVDTLVRQVDQQVRAAVGARSRRRSSSLTSAAGRTRRRAQERRRDRDALSTGSREGDRARRRERRAILGRGQLRERGVRRSPMPTSALRQAVGLDVLGTEPAR